MAGRMKWNRPADRLRVSTAKHVQLEYVNTGFSRQEIETMNAIIDEKSSAYIKEKAAKKAARRAVQRASAVARTPTQNPKSS